MRISSTSLLSVNVAAVDSLSGDAGRAGSTGGNVGDMTDDRERCCNGRSKLGEATRAAGAGGGGIAVASVAARSSAGVGARLEVAVSATDGGRLVIDRVEEGPATEETEALRA